MKLVVTHSQGFDFSYRVLDNQAQKTVLLVHGYHSSSDLGLPLENLARDFNLVALDLPGSPHLPYASTQLTIQLFKAYLKTFLDFVCPFKKVILLGHSLAGLTISALAQHEKVEALIYLATVQPGVVNSQSYRQLSKTFGSSAVEQRPELAKYISTHPEMEEIFIHRARINTSLKTTCLTKIT
ncbi:alpha/beta hydrolase [Mycoplasma sp. ATU-Cv-508]|uniref:alpha/beta fold hydrolase n=1 Tax=Mycoplasma sp. ATU-Cv-508 TaxID=2048001 RepID=UPI000FDEC7E9